MQLSMPVSIQLIQANLTSVRIGNVQLWFSYETVVAFSVDGERVACQNIWSGTTGKHLNAIDGGDKKGRVAPDEFKHRLSKALAPLTNL